MLMFDSYGGLEPQETIESVRNWGDYQLEPYVHDQAERWAQIDYLLTGILDWNYSQLSNNANTILEDELLVRFKMAINAIKGGRPVQYALGHAAFYGREFNVDSRVLIPRQETEELVEWILNTQAKSALDVLDIGTGSSAIATTLAVERPEWHVTASDISSDALAVAKSNADKFDATVNFIESDLFAAIDGQYDVIVSNPPYIAESEEAQMDTSVLGFEPHLALFADDEGLALYKKMAQDLLRYLKPTGQAFFEIGYQQGPALVALFETLPNVTVTLKQDMSGHDRMIRVQREA